MAPCSATAGAASQPIPQVQQLAGSLTNGAVASVPAACSGAGANDSGILPFVVASSAGGKFAADASGGAPAGFWHGYTIVRLDRSGDPRCTIVEQRPVLDWVTITAIGHELQPGQHLQLHGFGREPVGVDEPARYDDISTPAITHRYDLVQADPARPYLPKIDPSSPAPNHYVPLDPSVATIDQQTGYVQTGSGSHPRVYAIAILSVGNQAAGWPIDFEPRRSFTQRPSILPQLPPITPPAPSPPVHLAAVAAAPPPPPTSAPPSPPEVATPQLPTLPNLVAPPPIAALTPPTPPPPPAPPPPPSQPAPLPLALQAKLSPVGINATVVPPSPPPVNPAPPSGSAARKEAKQRQAAAAKSEEGGAEGGSQAAEVDRGDTPVNLPGADMTRNQQAMTRLQPPARAVWIAAPAVRPQPSAWVLDLEYGGGLALAGLILALSFTLVRPTPRRREPRLPAPAWVRPSTRR
jgi:hypothetical protein